MVKIVVDSTCDLDKELMNKYNIEVLPLRISINNEEFLDKVNVDVDYIYEKMRMGIVPKTSQVNPQDAYNVFEKLCKSKEEFIYIAFSSHLSGTYGLCKNILDEFKERFNDLNMEIVDSKTGAAAVGLMALQGAKMAEKGLDFNSILANIHDMVEKSDYIFSISDLNWLTKGGRISKFKGTIGGILDIKPILKVNDGCMEVIKMVRGKKRTLKTVVDLVCQEVEKFQGQIIGISHADDIETANEIMKMIDEKIGKQKYMVSKIGSVLGTHLGIGGVGITFFKDEIKSYMK
ncbi:MAG: DegV family protein [Clostridium perfringens]|nr:DegV family protein [Clostridium perfringens]